MLGEAGKLYDSELLPHYNLAQNPAYSSSRAMNKIEGPESIGLLTGTLRKELGTSKCPSAFLSAQRSG